MTVKDLIQELQEYPEDMLVLTRLNRKKGGYEPIRFLEYSKMINAYDYGDYCKYDEDYNDESEILGEAILLDTGTYYD